MLSVSRGLGQPETFDVLHWKGPAGWSPLPAWAQFFARLGMLMGHHSGKGLVLALALPTRAYATSLLCLGLRLAGNAPEPDAEQHFASLCGAAVDTPVTFLHKNRKLKGVLDGVADVNGERRLRVRVSSPRGGNLTHLIAVDQSKTITLSDAHGIALPKTQKGVVVYLNSRLDQALGLHRTANTPPGSCPWVVGPITVISSEVLNTPLAVKQTRGFVEGCLQDILHVDRFARRGEAPAVRLLASRSGRRRLPTVPSLVIFDGARSFLRDRDTFQSSTWVVVLDRTEQAFADAAAELNQSYSLRQPTRDLPCIDSLPQGVEAMVFAR